MAANKSLINTFLLNVFLLIFSGILGLGLFLISDRYSKFDKEVQDYQDEYINFRKEMIRDEVELVVSYIHFRKNQLTAADSMQVEAAKKEILEWINKIRLRQNQYIIVNRFDGTVLAHYKKQNIGRNMWNFTDRNGVKAVQDAIAVSKQKDGGYVRYIGSIRPSTGKPGKKITYAKGIPEWEWTVLTGVYMDDIDLVIADKREELKKNINMALAKISLILILLIFVFLMIVRFITVRLKYNFQVLSAFFREAATNSEKIDKTRVHFSEFQDLATSVNRMTEEKLRINEELDRYQSHLEELVEKRTVDLEESNRKLNEENKHRRSAQKEKEIKILQLQAALKEVKALQGMLPICSKCKKIRDDEGYWNNLEAYIEKHSQASFSHGLCPDCLKKLYGDKEWYVKKK